MTGGELLAETQFEICSRVTDFSYDIAVTHIMLTPLTCSHFRRHSTSIKMICTKVLAVCGEAR